MVFADLEGVTAFTDEYGDAAALALLTGQRRHATGAVHRNGGRIVSTSAARRW